MVVREQVTMQCGLRQTHRRLSIRFAWTQREGRSGVLASGYSSGRRRPWCKSCTYTGTAEEQKVEQSACHGCEFWKRTSG